MPDPQPPLPLHPACATWLHRPLLVGLSGGRDSVALLHALHEAGCPLSACHLHHGIRGEEADADADFCRELCAQLGIALHIERQDVPALARDRGLSLETAARSVRRQTLLATAARRGCAAIALAHHADDQAETVLFRLARGSAGPRGMLPVHKAEGMTWLRPLLDCPRRRITDWLLARGLHWREDASNARPDVARNRLRLEVLPALQRALGRDVAPILNRSARLQAETAEALDCALGLLPLIDPQGRLYLPALAEHPLPLVKAALHRYLSRAGVPDVSEDAVLALAALLSPEAPASRANLPGGWQAARRHKRLELLRGGAPVAVRWNDKPTPLT